MHYKTKTIIKQLYHKAYIDAITKYFFQRVCAKYNRTLFKNHTFGDPIIENHLYIEIFPITISYRNNINIIVALKKATVFIRIV